ncbi:MAG: glycosyltransferase [Pyrinomonadaceae bacterium]
MAVQISVITCSHNPRADYLAQVIEALKNQTLDNERWEFLLIDNASDEALATRVDVSWQPNARHIREEELGLTHARLRGIREAQGEILVFVDDDNVLDADYLEQVMETGNKHSMIGAWGGQRRPVFEQQPPEWTRRHWGHLALSEFEKDSWSNNHELAETMPNGAGLCVRDKVASYYRKLHEDGKRAFVMDRNGNSLVSGGDVDLASCACDLGMGIGLFAALKLSHLIPSDRLTEDYLLRLTEGIGYSGVILYSFRPTSLPSRGWIGKAADILRYLRMDAREKRVQRAHHRGRSRAHKELATIRKTLATDAALPADLKLERQ